MMSQSSSKEIDQGEQAEAIQRKNKKKKKKKAGEWLEEFLKKTFFESCSTHPIRRNETNRYCINCNLSACQYCMSSPNHRHHKILKIYKHVYKDVVSLTAMEKYIDCSHIQPFKCNKRLVISLNPLPHCGPLLNTGVCEVCRRRLAEPELYNYCSISCKVTAFARKSSDSDPPFLSIQIPTIIRRNKESNTEKPKRRRKGIPCRAPFF